MSTAPHPTFVVPPTPSPALQVLLTYIDALNRWDGDAIMGVFHPNLVHQILPRSLGRQTLNYKEYSEYLQGFMMPLMKSFTATLHEVVEAADGQSLTVHTSSVGESFSGTPYANEYMLMMHVAPVMDGSSETLKIVAMKEFVDSAFSMTYFANERAKWAAEQKKPHGGA
ncbi:hypothetical protein BD779DRAFT_1513480 [Infundibulicybe gibba]|nr:hypothetical protein BD779DRAFT_1513480 [Infundibulicybe gibba]